MVANCDRRPAQTRKPVRASCYLFLFFPVGLDCLLHGWIRHEIVLLDISQEQSRGLRLEDLLQISYVYVAS
jgi:hypothetical protein